MECRELIAGLLEFCCDVVVLLLFQVGRDVLPVEPTQKILAAHRYIFSVNALNHEVERIDGLLLQRF
jgi:hypothetical protein